MTTTNKRWSVSSLVDQISKDMKDDSFVRWLRTDYVQAIKGAVLLAQGYWSEEQEDASLTYDMNVSRYTLPSNIGEITTVSIYDTYMESIRLVPSTVWKVISNTLVFSKNMSSYDGGTIHIVYRVNHSNILEVSGTDGVISGYTLTSASSSFITDDVNVCDEVIVNGETAYVTEVVSDTELTLSTQLTAGSSLSFSVAEYTKLPFAYLKPAVIAELYELSARNKPGLEISQNFQLAAYYKSIAEKEIGRLYHSGREVWRY